MIVLRQPMRMPKTPVKLLIAVDKSNVLEIDNCYSCVCYKRTEVKYQQNDNSMQIGKEKKQSQWQ